MIVKSMTRKSESFVQIVEYIEKSSDKSFNPILHNLKTARVEVKEIINEFKENARHCPVRRNGVVLYHEVLAISGRDKSKVSPDLLEDLGRKYLELRAGAALGYGAVHFDHPNPHIHFVISGNLIESPKKLRLSKRDFNRVKIELERYQREQYPFLKHSVIFDSQARSKQSFSKSKEDERKKRLEKQGRAAPSRKERARDRFLACLTASKPESFDKKLQASNLQIYVRGDTIGILDIETGTKYRLEKLGILEEYREAWRRWTLSESRVQEIESLEIGKLLKKWKEYGFKKDIAEVLYPAEDQEKRQFEIKQIQADKRHKSRKHAIEL